MRKNVDLKVDEALFKSCSRWIGFKEHYRTQYGSY